MAVETFVEMNVSLVDSFDFGEFLVDLAHGIR